MPTSQVPLFLSSAVNHGIDAENVKFEVHMQPPLEIPGDLSSARVFCQSASIPYSFPNVTSENNTIVINVPDASVGDGFTQQQAARS